jgi:uncharacterized protein (TIGR03000 family)
MTHRHVWPFALGSMILVSVLWPSPGHAQVQPPPDPAVAPPEPVPLPNPPSSGQPLVRRLDWEAAAAVGDSWGGSTILGQKGNWVIGAAAGPGIGPWFGPGYWHFSGWPYGPRVAPPWTYPGLMGGPFVTYPWFVGPVYSGRSGSTWSNGLSLYGPPVPTYGPIPGVMGNDDLRRQWRAVPSPGVTTGWVGIYAASPRPKPLTVSVWPQVESIGSPGVAAPVRSVPTGGCLILSVKLPQPAAELIVDGVKTSQTGTDRIFNSPPLEAGKVYRYELTARWVAGGVTHEKKKVVTGSSGEVVRVDFTTD